MYDKQLTQDIFKAGKKAGMDDMEVYYSEGETFEVKISKGEIDGYKVALSKGLGFRGLANGKIGYSYTEKVAKDSIDDLVRGAVGNATINDGKDKDFIFEGSPEYTEVSNMNLELEKITEKQKIDFAREMEAKALAADPRIKASQYCVMGTMSAKSFLENTKGLNLSDSGNQAYAYIMVLAEQNGNYSSGLDFVMSNDFSLFDTDVLVNNATKRAIDFLDASPVKSGEYEILIDGLVASDLLASISSIFSARSVQKNLSLLKGQLGKNVASEHVTIVDDPFYKGGAATASFDGEGVATKYKEIISNGVLQTYLHNLKSAARDNVKSTGNAARGSYKSTIGISASNLYFKPGKNSLENMISEIINGIHIVELDGMHSGFNPISGDFSLPAKGYLIENGEKKKAVNQITLSGNYYELLKNIRAVGSDLQFSMGGRTGSPSVLTGKLSVAGE